MTETQETISTAFVVGGGRISFAISWLTERTQRRKPVSSHRTARKQRILPIADTTVQVHYSRYRSIIEAISVLLYSDHAALFSDRPSIKKRYAPTCDENFLISCTFCTIPQFTEMGKTSVEAFTDENSENNSTHFDESNTTETNILLHHLRKISQVETKHCLVMETQPFI